MKLILLGAPGAGKGTQAEMLSATIPSPRSPRATSSGKPQKGTEMGLKAKSFIDAGQLVPDNVVIGIIQERLTLDDCKMVLYWMASTHDPTGRGA